jgi:predicted transcriptional regulator
MDRKPATTQDIALVVAAADVAARFASRNAMSKTELGMMIADVHALLVDRVDNGPRASMATGSDCAANPISQDGLRDPEAQPSAAPAPPDNPQDVVDGAGTNVFRDDYIVAPPLVQPFLPISASVWTKRMVCLDCGKSFATLKRHLLAVHKQTDLEYRKKYGLSGTYPMICEEFESSRRQLMLDHGAFKPMTKAQRTARSVKMAIGTVE